LKSDHPVLFGGWLMYEQTRTLHRVLPLQERRSQVSAIQVHFWRIFYRNVC
jgi:hypothetical protein